MLALQAIKKGTVAIGGKTGAVMERSLLRMRDLIDRSLTEVRLRADGQPQSERLRLADVIAEIEATAAPEAEWRGIELHIETDPDLELDADRHMLVSATANLVQNAIRYTRAGGRVTLRGFANADRLILEIEDQCGGLPPGDFQDLFRPFVRKSTGQKGLGLGLAISDRAVRSMGGEIAVRDLPGRGCVFSIRLPLSARPRMAPPAPSPAVH